MKKKLYSLFTVVLLAAGIYWYEHEGSLTVPVIQDQSETSAINLRFPSDRYPETARHIKEAIRAGQSAVCTIDRKNADENRKHSLSGIAIKKGYDRDEWPMAMCSEGGEGADIKYIAPKDNRGAGSWVSHQLEQYQNGTKVKFILP